VTGAFGSIAITIAPWLVFKVIDAFSATGGKDGRDAAAAGLLGWALAVAGLLGWALAVDPAVADPEVLSEPHPANAVVASKVIVPKARPVRIFTPLPICGVLNHTLPGATGSERRSVVVVFNSARRVHLG